MPTYTINVINSQNRDAQQNTSYPTDFDGVNNPIFTHTDAQWANEFFSNLGLQTICAKELLEDNVVIESTYPAFRP